MSFSGRFRVRTITVVGLLSLAVFLAYLFLGEEDRRSASPTGGQVLVGSARTEASIQRGESLSFNYSSRTEPQVLQQTPRKEESIPLGRNAISIPNHAEEGKKRKGESFTDLERRALADPKPEERIRALERLSVSEDRARAVAVLVHEMHNDRDEEVRQAALDALEELEELSLEALVHVAVSDPDPSLRLRAVELIGERDEEDKRAVDLLRGISQRDQHEEVREAATELFDEMNADK